jgi:diguanylate cyclase (GGDEF)-like protein
MTFDPNSLLLATGVVGACLSLTLFGAWFTARSDRFLLTWSIGLLFLVGYALAYGAYVETANLLLGMLGAGLCFIGFSLLLGAAVQFRGGTRSGPTIAVAGTVSLLTVLPPFALGYDGLGIIASNLAAATLLFLTAIEYWKSRAEAPLSVIALAVFYALPGCASLLGAAVAIADGKLVVGHAPDNWAEDLSLIVSVGSLAMIGTLSLVLNQSRLAGRLRRETLTDPLTGLSNRRALFALHGRKALAPDTAVVIFDLDHFKSVNDRFGHAVGDRVLERFAATLQRFARPSDTTVRLGGEEFVLILPEISVEMARLVAEDVRAAFGAVAIVDANGEHHCTVSAGLAVTGDHEQSLDAVLHSADEALYTAKKSGRNRVALTALKLAS